MIEGIIVEGLIYGIMALGVFLSFRVLDFPDLSVDGTFPLGAAVMAICLTGGMNMGLALLVSFTAGFIAGGITAVIHNKLGVPSLLAGILTMTMLWSINIRVLGSRANLPLLRTETILTSIRTLGEATIGETAALLIFFVIVVLIIKLLLDLFFHTDLGLTMGAMGDNEQMIISQGVNPEMVKIIGVGLSNGLVAISGAFAAQYQGFADVNLGQGIVVSGLAMVMLGEFLFSSNRIGLLTLRVILGAILYKAIMFFGRYYGYYINLTPNDLKLLTGLLIILSLILTKYRSKSLKFRRPAND
ncbi:MAG: ABC transporter permease [Spirochaetales bacterium]|uniref:ABC transporter permease n=1 Tax=Candidatus Thalassospirochaeta sargassi TaxID=3119039 RepID=A0AAJ1IAQ7_9SPIO|nr:ABC transporter permease [Spirochaetales bacterium]